jgi:hypothetical protein
MTNNALMKLRAEWTAQFSQAPWDEADYPYWMTQKLLIQRSEWAGRRWGLENVYCITQNIWLRLDQNRVSQNARLQLINFVQAALLLLFTPYRAFLTLQRRNCFKKEAYATLEATYGRMPHKLTLLTRQSNRYFWHIPSKATNLPSVFGHNHRFVWAI